MAYGLLTNMKAQWRHTHVSGHGIIRMFQDTASYACFRTRFRRSDRRNYRGSAAKTVVPIRTEHEEYHEKWHKNVIQVKARDPDLK
ncbi:MAG: hypothetical protein M3P08_09740 [Thermoproteota archaeon]|nr:hypothetical protein [Thermoproteota archaeon]